MGTATKAKVEKAVTVRSKAKPAAARKRKLTEAEIEALEDAEDNRICDERLKDERRIPFDEVMRKLGI